MICDTSDVDSTPHERFIDAALEQATLGRAEGGIPIGSVLELDGRIVGAGRNRRVQQSSPTRHAEIDCIESAGRLTAGDYRRATIYTTLSPCDMCTGAVLLYGIARVVVGENRTFLGAEDVLRARGVDVVVLDDARCVELMSEFIVAEPTLWFEDIGEDESDHQADHESERRRAPEA